MALNQPASTSSHRGCSRRSCSVFADLAQFASKLSLDTSIPTIGHSLLATISGVNRQGSASGYLVHGISGRPRPGYRPAWTASSGSRALSIPRLTKGTHEAHRFPCCSSEICPRRTSRNVQGTALPRPQSSKAVAPPPTPIERSVRNFPALFAASASASRPARACERPIRQSEL